MRTLRAPSSKRWSAARFPGCARGRPIDTNRQRHAGERDHRPVIQRHQCPDSWASADSNGYPSHAWMTFKQAQDHGAQWKGERGTHVVFTKPIVFKGEDDEIENDPCCASTPFSTSHRSTASKITKSRNPDLNRSVMAAVEAFIVATKADIRYGGNVACYVPSRDFINMPPASVLRRDRSQLRHRTSRTWSSGR